MSGERQFNITAGNVINCAVYAVIGLVLLILKGESLGILMSIIGALFIIMGLIDVIVKKETVNGLVQIGIGVLIIVFGWLIAEIVLLIFGILLIVSGIMELIQKFNGGLVGMIPAIVTIVLGIMFVVAKWALLDVFCIIAGVIFLVNAGLVLFGKKLTK